MEEKKKTYEAPKTKVYQVHLNSVICASAQSQTELLTEEEFTW